MQINRNMSAVIANNHLLRTENRLSASIERLSSGLKINHASDNPAGIAISSKMKTQIDALDQAETNASNATSVIQIADGALGEVASILQRMRELSVQAANGTNAYQDRQSIQAEIDELQKEVDRISSDTEYNTKTLLDGSSDVRVYGANGSRYYVTESVAAQIYTLDVKQVGEQATVALDYKVPQEEGIISINGVAVNVSAGMSEEVFLQQIRNAAQEAGFTVSVDENKNQILIKSDFYGYDESIEFSISSELAEDLKVADLNQEDCEYLVNGPVMEFEKLPEDANGITVEGVVSIDSVEIPISIGMTNTEYYAAVSEVAQNLGYNAIMNESGNLEVKSKKAGATEVIEFSFSNVIADELKLKYKYDGEYTVNTNGKDAVVEFPANMDRIAAGFTATTTIETEGNRVTITDSNNFEIDFLLNESYKPVDNTTDGSGGDPNGNFEIEVTDIGSMTIQIGGNEYQTMDIRISEVSSESLYIDSVDVSVVNGAERAMNTLDEAIAKLSATRSRLGAFQNRLDYATTSLETTGENVTAAYSRIMDTDMATEMTEYTQQNILNQAAISVLAQANELPQQILSLLQ